MSEPEQAKVEIIIGSVAEGYHCPKDGARLELIDHPTGLVRHAGSWCPTCRTLWQELGEIPVNDRGELT